MTRLAGGVVPAADRRVWPAGPVVLPGAPVVVGPRSARPAPPTLWTRAAR